MQIYIPDHILIILVAYYMCLFAMGTSMGRFGCFSPGGITVATGFILAGVAMFILDRNHVVSFPLYLTIIISVGQVFIVTSLYYFINRP